MSTADIDVSILEIYGSPKVIEKARLSDVIKRALVIPKTFKKNSFLLNATKGKSHDFMIFYDVGQAKEWLPGTSENQ